MGFPGETDLEFKESLAFAKKLNLSEAHVFSYSNRKGTKADKMPNQVPKKVKEERNIEMSSLCNSMHSEYMNNYVGKTVPVLFEQEIENGIYEGHMTNYIKVVAPSSEDVCHKILDVVIEKCENGVAYGKLN